MLMTRWYYTLSIFNMFMQNWCYIPSSFYEGPYQRVFLNSSYLCFYDDSWPATKEL